MKSKKNIKMKLKMCMVKFLNLIKDFQHLEAKIMNSH